MRVAVALLGLKSSGLRIWIIHRIHIPSRAYSLGKIQNHHDLGRIK